MKKKIISFILVAAMVISHIPFKKNSVPTAVVNNGEDSEKDNPDSPDSQKKDNAKKAADSDGSSNVKFSHKAGFYNQAFALSLSIPEQFAEYEDAAIYYTTSDDSAGVTFPNEASVLSRHEGGVTPTVNSKKYEAPITVTIPSDVNVFTVSAVLVANGEVFAPVTKSYVRGANIQTRFDSDFYVFSLYSDSRGLFTDDEGIFMPGQDRQDWIDEYARINNRQPNFRDFQLQQYYPPTLPANFNRRGRVSEREVNVEMFDGTGTRLISQRAGMRVKGGWSRGTFAYDQKTFEFYARNSYGDSGEFLFPLFGEQHAADGNLIHSYKRFRLRNGGSDREQSYMRDELSHELYKAAGFADVQQHAPAVVFLNGEYYGLSWLKSPRTEEHFSKIYGGDKNRFHIIGSSEGGHVGCNTVGCGRVIAGAGEPSAELGKGVVKCGSSTFEQCIRPDCKDYWSDCDGVCEGLDKCRARDDWAKIRKLVRGSGGDENPNGLDDDAAFLEFCNLVDIDNLIHYYALGMYIANVDWPANNIEMWRYYPDNEEENIANLHPRLDGKWRFVAQDIEFGYGLWQDGFNPTATRVQDNTIRSLIIRDGTEAGRGHFGANASTYMIPALMRRSDVRVKFVNVFADLTDGAYKPENAVAVFDKISKTIQTEHQYMLADNTRRISEIAREGGKNSWPTWNEVSTSNSQLRDFLQRRPEYILGFIESELGYKKSDRIEITFKNADKGTAVMNTRPVGESETVTGNYYNGTSITLTAAPYPGYIVDSWIIDGNAVASSDSCTISNITKPVSVEVTYKKDSDFAQNGNLQITALKAAGDDWLEISNNTERTLSTSGLFLTDGKNLQKFEMPALDISAGESVKFNCKDSEETDENYAGKTNFNLSYGESLKLSDSNGVILQTVEVSRMNNTEIQMLFPNGKFKIVDETTLLPSVSEKVLILNPSIDPDAIPAIPENPGNPTNPNPGINSGDVTTTGQVTASYSGGTELNIANIPENGDWSVTINVADWPPSGGPWGIPDGVNVNYNNGALTFSGNGRYGWGENWNATWGYW